MHLLISPVFGAVIGFCANRLAVKMIFWPHRPITVVGIRVPMTPGLFVSRRVAFADAVAGVIVDRFCGPKDIIRCFGQAWDAGLEERVMATLPPMASAMIANKIRGLGVGDIQALAREISRFIHESGMVKALVTNNVEAMDAQEVEDMVHGVCGRELRSMAMFDAAVGAFVGLVQGLVTYLLS